MRVIGLAGEVFAQEVLQHRKQSIGACRPRAELDARRVSAPHTRGLQAACRTGRAVCRLHMPAGSVSDFTYITSADSCANSRMPRGESMGAGLLSNELLSNEGHVSLIVTVSPGCRVTRPLLIWSKEATAETTELHKDFLVCPALLIWRCVAGKHNTGNSLLVPEGWSE